MIRELYAGRTVSVAIEPPLRRGDPGRIVIRRRDGSGWVAIPFSEGADVAGAIHRAVSGVAKDLMRGDPQ